MDRSAFHINICGQFYLSVLNAEKMDMSSERHILIIPVAGTENVIRTIQIINHDADHCNSGKWELKRLKFMCYFFLIFQGQVQRKLFSHRPIAGE